MLNSSHFLQDNLMWKELTTIGAWNTLDTETDLDFHITADLK